MNDQNKDLPPLPKPFGTIDVYREDGGYEKSVDGFTADQMRGYVIDDRQRPAALAAPVADAQPVAWVKFNDGSIVIDEDCITTGGPGDTYENEEWRPVYLAVPTPPAPQEVEQARDAGGLSQRVWIVNDAAGEHVMMCPKQPDSAVVANVEEKIGGIVTVTPFDLYPADTPVADHGKHHDDFCVDQFAEYMKEKMAAARAKGRSGWDNPEQCSVPYLQKLFHEHVQKGDPIDVANFCMMLYHYRASTTPDFDVWQENPYTKVLQKSVHEHYVPRSDLRTAAMGSASLAAMSPQPADDGSQG